MPQGIVTVLENQIDAEYNSVKRHWITHRYFWRLAGLAVFLGCAGTASTMFYLAEQNRSLYERLEQYNAFQAMTNGDKIDALRDEMLTLNKLNTERLNRPQSPSQPHGKEI